MDQYELIRTAHRVYGKSIREIRRETGHHRETIRKALAGKEPKYRRREAPRCPVMDRVTPIIEGWLLDPEGAREAEVDWGTAWVEMAGERRRVKLFVMRSRYSGKAFVRAYPWERQEMFFDAHYASVCLLPGSLSATSV